MDEIDAQGRQMLIDRPPLTRGRLSVFRETRSADDWFPRLKVKLKRAGSDSLLWSWESHSEPIDLEEPPPYGEEVMLEKYFELEAPLKSPRGIETVFWLGPGSASSAYVDKFSAALYLYPKSLDERGVQVGVIDFDGGLCGRRTPVYVRVNFPW